MSFQAPDIHSMYNKKQLTSPIAQSALLILVIVLFTWFIIKPKLSQVTAKHATLATAKEQLEAVDSEKRQLSELVDQLQDSSEQVALTDEALPLSGRTSKTHILLDNLAKSSGMTVVQITAEDTDDIISAGNKALLADPFKAERSLHTGSYSVAVNGTIDQFKNYLELLETSGRILDVESFEILGNEPITKFRINVKAYAYDVVAEDLQ